MAIKLKNLDGDNLVINYNKELRNILNRRAPVRTKTVLNNRKVAWFDEKAKSLKAEVRRLEKVIKKHKSSNTVIDFKIARQDIVST